MISQQNQRRLLLKHVWQSMNLMSALIILIKLYSYSDIVIG